MNFKRLQLIFYSLVFILPSLKSTENKEDKLSATLKNEIQQSIAGTPVTLQFSSEKDGVLLYCTNSYSSVIITPATKENKIYDFNIPEHLYNKRGLIIWKLIHQSKELLTGNINIISSSRKTVLESYAGPSGIVAGGTDYFMLTVCPTDNLDNPLPDGTLITINHQFKNNIVTNKEFIKNLIAWKTIFSNQETGRFLVNSECNKVSSKEITTEVYPGNATNFSISVSKSHDFADGNQIATFKTSTIKDQYGNIVSDGTHVIFIIKNSKNTFLTTSGNTIHGIATAKMLHPYQKESWKVYAYINGIAESNIIITNFEQLFEDFNVNFSWNNRVITVGPLKSFMNQLIPDGFVVRLKIIQHDSLAEIKESVTGKGVATFKLDSDFYKNGYYNFIIETGGIVKKYNQKELKN